MQSAAISLILISQNDPLMLRSQIQLVALKGEICEDKKVKTEHELQQKAFNPYVFNSFFAGSSVNKTRLLESNDSVNVNPDNRTK